MLTAEKLWVQFQNKLKKYILSQVKDEALAQDLLQETFLKMQGGLDGLRQESRVAPWLYRIARNTITDHYRKVKHGRKEAEAYVQTAFSETSGRERTREFANCILPFIDTLPEKYREAVFLVEIEGVSQKELAERLGISYSGAKSRVQRGRAMLKDALLECCAIQADRYGNILHYEKRPQEEE